jgi:hypothetical protein
MEDNNLTISFGAKVDASVAKSVSSTITEISRLGKEAEEIVSRFSSFSTQLVAKLNASGLQVSKEQVRQFAETQKQKEALEKNLTAGIQKELNQRRKAWEDGEKMSLRLLKSSQAQALSEIKRVETEATKINAQELARRISQEREAQRIRLAMHKDEVSRLASQSKNEATADKYLSSLGTYTPQNPTTDTSAIGSAILFWTRLTGVIQAARVAYYTVEKGVGFLGNLIKEGLQYNSLIADSRMGFAGTIASFGRIVDLQGKLVPEAEKWNKALEISGRITESLQASAFKTKAIYSELARGLQEGLAPLISTRIKENQIEPFITRFVQTMSALRVPIREIGQEIRGLIAGDTNARTSRVANQFFQEWLLSGKKVKKEIKDIINDDEFYDWFMKKSAYLGKAGAEMMGNLSGAATNLHEAWERTLGEGTKALWDQLTKNILTSTDAIIKFDSEGKATFNDNLVEAIRKVAAGFGHLAAQAAHATIEMLKPGGLLDTFREWRAENQNSVDAKVNAIPNWWKDFKEKSAKNIDKAVDFLDENTFKLFSLRKNVDKLGNADKNLGSSADNSLLVLLRSWQNTTNGSTGKPAVPGFFDSVSQKNVKTPATATIQPGPKVPESEEERQKREAKEEKERAHQEAIRKKLESELALIATIHVENQKRIEDVATISKIQEVLNKLNQDSLSLDIKRLTTLKQISALSEKSITASGESKASLVTETNYSFSSQKLSQMFEAAGKIQTEFDNQHKKTEEEVTKIQQIRLENQKRDTQAVSKIDEIRNKLANDLLELDKKRLGVIKEISGFKDSSFKEAGTTKDQLLDEVNFAYGSKKFSEVMGAAQKIQEYLDKEGQKRAAKEAKEYARQVKEAAVELRVFETAASDFISGISKGAKGFGQALGKYFTDSISMGSGKFLDQIMAMFTGVSSETDNTGKTIYKDRKGNVIQGAASLEEAVVKGGNKDGLKNFQTGLSIASTGYSGYTAGKANQNGAITQSVIGGGLSGLSTGNWVVAVIGAIVGGIAAAAGKAAARDEYKYAHFVVSGGVAHTDLGTNQNITADKLKEMSAQVQQMFEDMWGGMVNLMIKIHGVIPALTMIDGKFQDNPSKNYLEHYDDWLNNKLPQDIVNMFKPGMEKVAVNLGMSIGKFNLIWSNISSLDPKKQVEVWNNLFGALQEFDAAMKFLRGNPTNTSVSGKRRTASAPGHSTAWETYRDQEATSVLHPTFELNTKDARDRMVELGNALSSLTGQSQISAAKELSGLMTEYVQNAKAFMKELVTLSRDIKEDVDQMILDLTADGLKNTDGTPDLQKQAEYYKNHADDILNQMRMASNPDDVRKFWEQYKATLTKIQSLQSQLGPENAEAVRLWMIKALTIGNEYFQAKINQLGDSVNTLNDWVTKNIGPFVTAFTSLIGDVNDGLGGLRDGVDKLPGPIDKLPDPIEKTGIAFNNIVGTIVSADSALANFAKSLNNVATMPLPISNDNPLLPTDGPKNPDPYPQMVRNYRAARN